LYRLTTKNERKRGGKGILESLNNKKITISGKSIKLKRTENRSRRSSVRKKSGFIAKREDIFTPLAKKDLSNNRKRNSLFAPGEGPVVKFIQKKSKFEMKKNQQESIESSSDSESQD